MSGSTSFEYKKLRSALDFLENRTQSLHGSQNPDDLRFLILEAASSFVGKFDIIDYWRVTNSTLPNNTEKIIEAGRHLAQEILPNINIHPSFSLATLATPEFGFAERRRKGAYYTDSRLAKYICWKIADKLTLGTKWLDPASGSGILLIAAVLQFADSNQELRNEALKNSVHAADRSQRAIRGARLALASLTNSIDVIRPLTLNLRCIDSLEKREDAWRDRAPDGFDVLIGNPPWEKLKVSRHEFLLAQGEIRHYGATYEGLSEQALNRQKRSLATYIAQITEGLLFQGSGEADLYKCFLELAFRLGKPDSAISFLVPGGLIRSEGTQPLREYLIENSSSFRVDILDNKAHFFAIDTRTKFLALFAQRGEGPAPIEVGHAAAMDESVSQAAKTKLAPNVLKQIRPDYTLPEVRSEGEWRLFQQAFQSGARLHGPDSPWKMDIVREVDMTNHRPYFTQRNEPSLIPVIEGRMVHNFHFGAKAFIDGTGRRSKWEPRKAGSPIQPQFRIPRTALPEKASQRVDRYRIGFCDVTGQTNERTLLAAMIPPGVVCGNKVPTISLQDADGDFQDKQWLWLALANSFCFDWLLRRVVTTSLNFFLLRSLVFPHIEPNSPTEIGLINRSKILHPINNDFSFAPSPWERGEIRAWIDAVTAIAYGYGLEDFSLVLDDFPLLDRGQPRLPGESRSTITRDLAMLAFCQQTSKYQDKQKMLSERVGNARSRGAVPYVPNEFVGVIDKDEEAV